MSSQSDQGPGFTRKEEAQLAADLSEGLLLRCPRCDTHLTSSPVPRRSDLYYVRSRMILVCTGCGARGVVDTRQS